MTDSAVATDLIARRLERMPAERNALQLALGQFGDDFDLGLWARLYESFDPADMNGVRQVTAGFSELSNHCTELVRTAVTLTELLPHKRPPNAAANYRALRDAGGITAKRCEHFTRLNRVRNHLAHIYIDVTAKDIHAATLLLLAELPGFVKDYVSWLENHGVKLNIK